jgi:hypothetical protein
MAKASTRKPAAKPARAETGSDVAMVPGIFVRSFPPTFRRAGFEFTAEGHGLPLTDLNDDQLKAIRDEPLLHVQDVEFPATDADDAALLDQLNEDGGGAKDSANSDQANA